LSKKWFDKRAVEGGKWAVIRLHKRHYIPSTYEAVDRVVYSACPILNLPKHSSAEVLRNDLTKDEAMAMEKFLNFNERINHG
jgi:hypothetical protein